ncbi:MAG: CheB methylesterase domain-containing protein [Peptostreptococcales bacterium]
MIEGKSMASIAKVIAIGASTGGTNAIYDILKEFENAELPGIVIVQHMPPVFTALYAERLNKNCIFDVKEATDGDEITPGKVLIAPGGFHMMVEKKGSQYFIRTQKGLEEDKVNGHCPSVDVLFHSIAKEVGKKAIGVLLTGMGKDGAQGLLAMRNKGAMTIGQDEKTSIVYGMPKAAYEIGAVTKQLPLESIARELYEMTR